MSIKHRQWAGALARDCGIHTMFQQTATKPASNPAPVNGHAPERRRYRKHRQHSAEELAAIAADRYRGMSWVDLCAKYDVANNVIQKALAAAPKKPVRQEGESHHKYGRRVQTWMMQIDPEYRERLVTARGKGIRLAARRRKRAAEKAAEAMVVPMAAPLPPPVNVEAIQPVAAVEPPWGFYPQTAPTDLPPPRVGFWRSVGMMLGIVR